MMEIWKPIPGMGYEASNLGKIRNAVTKREIKPAKHWKGYLRLVLRVENRRTDFRVHRLVMLAFAGPSSLQVRHLDGDPENNAIDNLAYGTQLDNEIDKIVHGTSTRKLTMGQATEIRRLASRGIRVGILSKRYGVDKKTIKYLLEGRTYKP